ncbi:MAG: hypothetical protein H0X36_02925 [Sphingomonadaceae bacterium]|nr:hypothetical protein [Sphingomonadaceae bacterium]
MRQGIKIAVLGLVLIAPVSMSLAASKSPKLARCDGKHRRPANVYGSILPTVDPANGTVIPASAPKGGVDVFPLVDPAKPNPRSTPPRPSDKPAPKVPPISAITPPTSYGSC